MSKQSIRAPLEPSTEAVANRWRNCQDVADLLGISRREAQRLAMTGHLPAYAIPGMRRQQWRFRRHEVEAAMRPSHPAA